MSGTFVSEVLVSTVSGSCIGASMMVLLVVILLGTTTTVMLFAWAGITAFVGKACKAA